VKGGEIEVGSRRGSALSGALVLIAGVLAGTAGIALGVSAPATTRVSPHFAYLCSFPSGEHLVGVDVAATFPATTVAGKPVRPASVRISAWLPEQAVSELAHIGATSVAASATLATSETAVSQTSAAHAVTAQWYTQARPGVPIKQGAGVRLAWPATAPAAIVGGGSAMTFTAAGLVLLLRPARADGTATTPATLRVACALANSSNGRLAVIRVAGTSPSARASGAPARSRHKANFPKGCGKIKVVGTGTATCAYLTGFSDVAKLFGAAALQPKLPAKPGLVNVDFAERHRFADHKRELVVSSTAELYYKGRRELPPVTATFLAFRFVPVTATILLKEVTPIRIVSTSGITAPPYPIFVRTSSKISIRISSVKVNGVQLKVGGQCRTAKPVRLVLIGRGENTFPPKGYTVSTGGPLTGTLTIPPFTGCGVTENLDPLLTGSISGPGNFVKLTQGKLCGPSAPANWTCPPPVPPPQR
jgi:uncharacterized protein DUF6801